MSGLSRFAFAISACLLLLQLAACERDHPTRAANHPPQPQGERIDKLVKVGEPFTFDAATAGAKFFDPDGDALSYAITLRGATGITVDGTKLSGSLGLVGAVEVTVTATDPAGAIARTAFIIAAPAAEPGAPRLPATPYIYRDESLPLPDAYRKSSEGSAPLWDAQAPNNRTTDAGAALGRVLFFDKRLSITNTLACASCHQREHGFAAPERFSKGVIGVPLTRNTMALANTRYNIHKSWFADLRVTDIKAAVQQAITRTDELGNTLPAVERKLRATPFYAALFASAFGSPDIAADKVLLALEQYVQSLISYRTRLDQGCDAVNGFEPICDLALNPEEARGREIFLEPREDHIRCSQCHLLPDGGNIWLGNNGLDAVFTDPGVGNGRFRAASLHNIALTAPYMHDGRFATLREVIDHYDHGIHESRDLDTLLRDPNGQAKKMNLSEQDKAALEAFLRALSDNEMLADPKFSDPFQ